MVISHFLAKLDDALAALLDLMGLSIFCTLIFSFGMCFRLHGRG